MMGGPAEADTDQESGTEVAPTTHPANGNARYLAWAAAEFFFVTSIVVATFFAVLSTDIASALKLDDVQLGTLSGTFFLIYSVSQLLLGSLLGIWPTRLVMTVTAMSAAAGCILFALSSSMALAMAARVLMGIGLSCTFVGVIHVIQRDCSDRFSLLAALSQALANLTGAGLTLLMGVTALFVSFRPTFVVAGIFCLVAAAAAMFLIDRGRQSGTRARRPIALAPAASLCEALKACAGSLQFWMALIYFGCLHGTMLAYANLWDIQFQKDFFRHDGATSDWFNAMIPLGVVAGSIGVGIWAHRRGDHVVPARGFGLLTVAAFAIMQTVHLPEHVAMAMNFVIGIGVSGAVLGLTTLKEHLPAPARALATAIVVTAGNFMGGILQPLIGSILEAPLHVSALHALLRTNTPDFDTYQQGFGILFITVIVGSAASLAFRSGPAHHATAPSP